MRRGPSRKAWVPPLFGASGAARFNLIGNIQPVREDSTRSEEVESSRSGATPHRQQACARVSSLTLHMAASNRVRPCSAAPDPLRCTRSEGVQCLRIGCTTSSTTSMIADNLAGVGHADIQRAQVEQRCTRYSSNALDRKALHCLLSSATLR